MSRRSTRGLTKDSSVMRRCHLSEADYASEGGLARTHGPREPRRLRLPRRGSASRCRPPRSAGARKDVLVARGPGTDLTTRRLKVDAREPGHQPLEMDDRPGQPITVLGKSGAAIGF